MPGEQYDTFHDYRPDPKFEIKSHLYGEIVDSHDESGIYSDELIDIVSKGEGSLDDYHDKFYMFVASIGAEFVKPLKEESEEEESADNKAPEWKDVAMTEKIITVRRLSWDQLVANLAVQLKDAKEDMKPDNAADWYSDFINSFPYLESIYRKLPDYFMVKDYFMELKPVMVNYISRSLVDIAEEKEDMEKAKDEVKPIGKKIMWALIAFRNTYLNFMFKTLRDGGLNITHKMAGSIDITSDYDTTFGGADDVAAACEFYRAFRAEWLAEPGTIFDANVYCRDWMTVEDKTLHPSAGNASDDSLQALVLDFIGDMYGLLKLRRYTSKVEWAAFCNSVQRDINVDGLRQPKMKEVENSYIMMGSDIPMFRRLELIDEIYREQFVVPLLGRAGDVHKDLKESSIGQKLIEKGKDLNKATPRTLERLFAFDKNRMLKAMTMAYLELIAKSRLVEKQLETSHHGSLKWYQNDATAAGNGTLKEKTTKFSPEGMALFLEKSSVLMSEGVLFAIEPYFTQGAVWSVVGGGQSGLTGLNPSIHHRLQCFNEQVGDALKELREHLREIQEHELEKKEQTALEEKWDALLEASPAEYDAGLKEYEEEADKFNEERSAIKREQSGLGFYRASKYEKRMGEELEEMIQSLEADGMFKNRVESYQILYPDLTSPDNLDMEELKLELEIAKSFQKTVNELLAIRKSKKSDESGEDYSTKTNEEKIEAANKLIEEVVSEESDFDKLARDPKRLDSEINYAEASVKGELNKYTPEAPEDESHGVWGLRHLVHHLLWHAAAVNKHLRSILSRGPLEITVKNFAEDKSPADDSSTSV